MTGPLATGAPATEPPLGAVTAWSAGEPSPVGGADIRANTETSQAQNETSISINPNDADNWVGVANDYRTGNVLAGWYTTTDGGQSWTTGTFPLRPGFSFAGDPCVAFAPNGHVTAVFMNYQGPGGSAVSSHTSTDGGLTWGPRLTLDLAPSNDKPQMDIDRSNGPHRGQITAAWIRFASGDNVWAATTNNPLEGWRPAIQLNEPAGGGAIASDVAYGANSALYVMWADRGSNQIWVDRSFDGGRTYGQDVLVGPYNAVPSPIPGSTFRMFDIFAMSADPTSGPHGGNVYIAYHTWRTGAPRSNADVRCVTSTDQGATWTRNTLVNASDPSNADQVFPGVRVDENGNVNITYYDRRLDPNNSLLWTWLARSSDGGATFREHQASDVGWNHRQTEFGGGFIGDYIDVDCSANAVLPLWCDGRSGTQDVFVDVLHPDFYTDTPVVSASLGGVVNFEINVGPNLANAQYLMLGTASGTSPGLPIGSVTLPINPDPFTQITLAAANSAFFPNSAGTLDGTGSAAARFDTGGPLPGTSGLRLDFAVLVYTGGTPLFATNATSVRIVE